MIYSQNRIKLPSFSHGNRLMDKTSEGNHEKNPLLWWGGQSVFVTLGDCILFSGLLTGCVLVLRDFIDTITPALRVISYVNLVDSQLPNDEIRG